MFFLFVASEIKRGDDADDDDDDDHGRRRSKSSASATITKMLGNKNSCKQQLETAAAV